MKVSICNTGACAPKREEEIKYTNSYSDTQELRLLLYKTAIWWLKASMNANSDSIQYKLKKAMAAAPYLKLIVST